MTPPTKTHPQTLDIGWPTVHFRCNACGCISDPYNGIEEGYCAKCARHVQTTTYVSIAVGNPGVLALVKEAMSRLRGGEDRALRLFPFQKAVIDAAKKLFTPTNADNPLEASEIMEKRRVILHGAVRDLEHAEKTLNT